jgi:Flp pilus assembly protein TadG
MEFTLVLLPLLAMLGVVVDTAWSVYAKATLQRAVRMGVRTGITLTSSQKVHYFQPPAVTSTAAATDVSANSDGDQLGNIMQVSVQGYSVINLMPRTFNWKTAADNNRDMSYGG